MAKSEPDKAEELIQSYKEFAHSRSIPYYWSGRRRRERLDRYFALWGTYSERLSRKDGLIYMGFGLLWLLITTAVILDSWKSGVAASALVVLGVFMGGFGLLIFLGGIGILIRSEIEERRSK